MENKIPAPNPTPQPKKNIWFGEIETREEALKVIKDASNGFYFFAGLQIVLGYFIMGASAIVDGVIFAVLAFLLRKFNSMVIAIFLLLLSVAGIVITGINRFGGGTGGRNIILAVIMVWVSVRAIQATFKLHK